MARTAKTGLDYFPLDVDFLQDRTIRRIMRKHGGIAASAMLALLSLIYRERGYYLPWNEDTCFDLSELANTDMDTMHSIVADAIRAGFFHDEQFRENGILTSKSIQEQYLVSTQKRKAVVIEEAYALVEKTPVAAESKCGEEEDDKNKSSANDSSGGISAPQTGVSGAETLFSEPEMQQSKVKEIESKEKEKQTTPLPPPKMEGAADGMKEGNSVVEDEKIPAYCFNKQTHNYDGLLYRLQQIHVTERREIDAILKLSDYGRIGHPLWGIISHNNWPRGKTIKFPGRFILSQLTKT